MSMPATSPCPCGEAQDPQVVTNPPGLAQISDRVDDFTGFRRALLRPLPGEQAIGVWRPAAGDLGLQVLEWWAYLADVLTFYNERIANESYLRTAQRQSSLANLVALLGYQPGPGIAATGSVAVLRTTAHPGEPLTIPADMRLSSVATPGVPTQTFEVDAPASFTGPSSLPVTLAPDTALQVNNQNAPASVLLAGQVSGVKAADQLVLVEAGFAGTDDNWSLVTVGTLTPATDRGTGAANTLVSFSAGGWGPTPAPPQPQAGTVADLAVQFEEDLATEGAGHGGYGSGGTAHAGGGTSGHSGGGTSGGGGSGTSSGAGGTKASGGGGSVSGGAASGGTGGGSGTTGGAAGGGTGSGSATGTHWNPGMSGPAGPGSTPQSTGYRLMRPTATAALWNNQSATSDTQVVIGVSASGSSLVVHMSAAVRAISPGDIVLFDCGAGSPSALAVVAGVAEELWAVPYPSGTAAAQGPADIAVTHTVLTLTLAGPDGYVLLALSDPTTVAVRYGFKDVGTIIGIPASALPALPATVGAPGSYTPAPGATAFLQDATGAGVLVNVTAAGPGQVILTGAGTPPAQISTPLAVPLQLLPDVVPVSRGTTVANEVLGSGNAALINQAFTLSKSPLTYLQSGNGSVAALTVWVDGVAWQQVPSFYGQAAAAAVYVVSRSPDQTVTTVTFGDGVNGARLTSGSGNVVATYRYGSGAASPPAGRLTTISQPQPNLASVQNPVAVTGGADPQAPADVRADAPASVFTFGRAISAVDYEVVAAQAPGVSRVAAYWTFDGAAQRTLVTMYVGDGPAAVAAASAALAGSDDPNRPVSVTAAVSIDLTLSCTLIVAADRQVAAVVAAATAAISDSDQGLFGPAQMGIGQWLYRSAVDAALMVPGVVAVHNLTVQQGSSVLDEVFDPGEGSFFDLPPGNVTIVGVSAGG
jgi:hypothetical protein